MPTYLPSVFARAGGCLTSGGGSGRPPQTAGTTNVPTPIVWGTEVVRQLSLNWMGDENWVGEPSRYQLGAHFTAGHGPLTFHAVRVNNQVIWAETTPVLADAPTDSLASPAVQPPTGPVSSFRRVGIDLPAHGLAGALELYPGDAGQAMSPALQAAYGTAAPAARMTGLGMLFFDRFTWGQASIGIPLVDLSISTLVSRFPEALDAATARIERNVDVTIQTNRTTGAAHDTVTTVTIPYPGDANPAHVLYDIFTNSTWGFNVPAGRIDAASFQAAAQRLHAEQFGLSLLWTGAVTLEALVQEILEHIHAVLDVDPATGAWRLRLLRGDYDFSDPAIPVIDKFNSRITSVKFAACDTPPTEVVVGWTNPENMNSETVSLQNPSSIVVGEEPNSVRRDYWMVRDAYLAFQLGLRDLRLGRARQVVVQAVVDYALWDLQPGDIVRLTIPELRLNGIACRVMSVIHDTRKGAGIEVVLAEDIFALTVPTLPPMPVENPQSTLTDPTPLDKAIPVELPFPLREDAAPDKERIMVLATDSANDCVGFRALLSAGSGWTEDGDLPLTATAALGQALSAEAVTVLPASALQVSLQGRPGPVVGGFVLIGDADQEWCFIANHDSSTGDVTLYRGVFDTVPRGHIAATPLWFLPPHRLPVTATPRPVGSAATWRFLTRTAVGTLDLAAAPNVPHTVAARSARPFRPAGMSIGGISWPAAAVVTGVPAVTVAWKNRNRLTEDPAAPTRWDAAISTSEPGQATLVEVLDANGNVVHSVTTLPGATSTDIQVADLGGAPFSGTIRLTAVRDGLTSLQSVIQQIEIQP